MLVEDIVGSPELGNLGVLLQGGTYSKQARRHQNTLFLEPSGQETVGLV